MLEFFRTLWKGRMQELLTETSERWASLQIDSQGETWLRFIQTDTRSGGCDWLGRHSRSRRDISRGGQLTTPHRRHLLPLWCSNYSTLGENHFDTLPPSYFHICGCIEMPTMALLFAALLFLRREKINSLCSLCACAARFYEHREGERGRGRASFALKSLGSGSRGAPHLYLTPSLAPSLLFPPFKRLPLPRLNVFLFCRLHYPPFLSPFLLSVPSYI